MRTTDDKAWKGARVTVMGLGLFGGGVGAARFAASRGARVTVTDLRDESELADSLAALDGLDIRYVLGHHDEADFAGADCVIVNPAVPRTAAMLDVARRSGAALTSEIVLFVERCRGRVLAVSGSNGKTTTTSLIGAILAAHDPRTVVGGNLGRSLLDAVDEIEDDAPVALEVSSFQLEWLGDVRWAPDVGVLTNVTPNHLDRHGTYEAYRDAKRLLVAHQSPEQVAVLNARDPFLRDLASHVPGQLSWFREPGSAFGAPGAWIEAGDVVVDAGVGPTGIMSADDIPLLGEHNRENVLAAVAAVTAWSTGRDAVLPETIAGAIGSFQGVEHRLELVRQVNGVRWYNDSIATTPESAICALRSFDSGTVVLIAGGYDKHIAFDELGREIGLNAAHLIVFGATANSIASAATAGGLSEVRAHRASGLDDAVNLARRLAEPGWTVALSPACASYDMFRNFEERGERFRQLVHAL